jgi:hypothetical protein
MWDASPASVPERQPVMTVEMPRAGHPPYWPSACDFSRMPFPASRRVVSAALGRFGYAMNGARTVTSPILVLQLRRFVEKPCLGVTRVRPSRGAVGRRPQARRTYLWPFALAAAGGIKPLCPRPRPKPMTEGQNGRAGQFRFISLSLCPIPSVTPGTAVDRGD